MSSITTILGAITGALTSAGSLATTVALNSSVGATTWAEDKIHTYMKSDAGAIARPIVTGLGDELTLLASMTVASTVSAFMPLGSAMHAASAINTIVATMTSPNIEGIPIRATRETTNRRADVAETTVIVQSGNNKSILQDNVTPHPREWTLEGYLASISGTLDAYFMIKPTIQMQAWYLDVLAKSRLPVWFKTHDNLFYQVLISDYTYSYEASTQNTVTVSLTLKEYIPLQVTTSTLEESADNAGSSYMNFINR